MIAPPNQESSGPLTCSLHVLNRRFAFQSLIEAVSDAKLP